MKRARPVRRRRHEVQIPGQSVQVDVKHLKLASSRFYQFTAIDEAADTARFHIAIQRIKTDHGAEFGKSSRGT